MPLTAEGFWLQGLSLELRGLQLADEFLSIDALEVVPPCHCTPPVGVNWLLLVSLWG